MGLLCGVNRQRKGGNLPVGVDIEAVGVLFRITGGLHIFLRLRRVGGQLFGVLIPNSRGRNKAAIGNLGVCTAEISLKFLIVQRIGNCLTQVLIGEQALRIVKGKHRRRIGSRNIHQRHIGICGKHILIGSGYAGGVRPDHVDVTLLECQIHGILVAEKMIDDSFYIGLLRIVRIDRKGNGARFLIEGFQHIRAAGDPAFGFCHGVLALIDVLWHDTEGGHIAQLPDIGRCQRQRNALLIIGDGVAGILCPCDLAFVIGLRFKVGATVCLIVLEGKENVFRSDRLSVRPSHAILNRICPSGGIFRGIGSKQRVVLTHGILIHQRQLGYAAGQHIEVVLAKHGSFNGSRCADGQRIDGIRACRFGCFRCWLCRGRLGGFCRGVAAGRQRQHHHHCQQKG